MAEANELLKIARNIFKDESIKLDSYLEDAEYYDSMAQIQFVIELENHYKVDIEQEEILPEMTFQEVLEIINGK